MNKPIGVFDSGVGGLTVLSELTKLLPHENFIYFADSQNAPYGPRSKKEIVDFSSKIIDFLLSKNCKLIVIACNTATAAAVNIMRQKYAVPIVGLEPAVKPACLKTQTGHIGVLATKGTFIGNHFKNTSEKYQEYVKIHLQVAKGLVELAENGIFEGQDAENLIAQYVNPLVAEKIDQLVLGCTHYPLFKNLIQKIAGENVNLLDSGEAVARRTKDVLMLNKIFNNSQGEQTIKIYSSKSTGALFYVASKLFNVGENELNVEIVKLS